MRYCVIVVLILLLGASRASADQITTAAGDGADAYIQEGTPTTNYGSTAGLLLKTLNDDAGTLNRKVYLRFDLSSLSTPITTAEIQLSLENYTITNGFPQLTTYHIYGLNDGSTAGNGILGDDWAESAINWNNAPANIVSGSGAAALAQTGPGTTNGGQATLLGTFGVVTAAPSSIVALTGDANSSLVNFLNANTTGSATFIITRAAFGSFGANPPSGPDILTSFASKENGSFPAPTLLVNEPTTGPRTETVITDATWRVTSTTPSADWNTSLTYDDSDAAGWQNAVNPSENSGNIWETSTDTSNSPGKTWFRKIFYVDGDIASVLGTFGFDDDGQVYINGHLIVDDTGGGATVFSDLVIDPSFLVQGENLLAVHGINTIAPDNSINDKLYITMAPEPGTLALLALTTPPLLCRRRRAARAAR